MTEDGEINVCKIQDFLTKYFLIYADAACLSLVKIALFLWITATKLWFLVLENWGKNPWKVLEKVFKFIWADGARTLIYRYILLQGHYLIYSYHRLLLWCYFLSAYLASNHFCLFDPICIIYMTIQHRRTGPLARGGLTFLEE